MSITPEQIKFAECNYFGKRNVEELSAERECIKRSERVIKRSLKKQKMCETNIEEMSRPEFVAETKKKIETVLDEAVKMGIKIHGKKDFFGDKSIWNIGNIMLATYNKGEVNIPLEGDLLVSKKGEVALIFIKERKEGGYYYYRRSARSAGDFVIFSFNYAKKLSVRNNVLRYLMKRD